MVAVVATGLSSGPEFRRVQGNTGSAVAFREIERLRSLSSMPTRVRCSGNGRHNSRSPCVIYPAVAGLLSPLVSGGILLENYAFFPPSHGDAADDTRVVLLH